MREEQIFHQALEQAADQRAAFLDAACGSDLDLRERVAVLLRAQENPGSFLQSPAPGVASSPTIDQPTERPGTQIGPYKLVEQIGEGGMGTVWMAQQTEPVRRLVAIKLIKSGQDSRQVLARFEVERQALALMDHPNIAKVLDARMAGDSGRPYVVMELVKGVPITRYCDEHHLTPRQRLELFVPVCQAIQHAHQKGIIHRDIKPSNVLVALYDDKPVPKIIDFGVAKATGQQLTEVTLNTGFGAVVGTLEYMSPEQAGFNHLDIDTRSDIYSLGVLLYELLAGSPPFNRKNLVDAGMLEMLRVIREQEPSKPSTKLSSSDALPSLSANRGTEPAKLTKLVRGELDWIVMKALEKDRARRYETANSFAVDLQRYLNDEQVQACPPSAGYRIKKFARRNRVLLFATATVAAVLIVGTLTSTLLAIWAMTAERLAENRLTAETQAHAKTLEARNEATEARRQAELSRKRAETNLARAREAVHMMTQIAQERLENVPHLERARVELLETALRFHLEFLKQQGDDTESRRDSALAYGRAGELHAFLGNRSKGNELLGEAIARLEKLVAEPVAKPADRVALVHHYNGLGVYGTAPHEEIVSKLQRAIELSGELVREDPNNLNYQHELANGYGNLGRELVQAEPAEAEKLMRRGLQLAEQMDNQVAIAVACMNLGYLRMHQGNPEAEKWIRRALAIWQERGANSTWHRFDREMVARSLSELGHFLSSARNTQAAADAFQRSADLWMELLKDYPTSLENQKQFTRNYLKFVNALSDSGQAEQLTTACQRAIDLNPRDARLPNGLAWLLATCPDEKLRNPARAVELAKRAIALDPKSTNFHNTLGVAYYRAGKWRVSIKSLTHSVDLGPSPPTPYNTLFLAMAHWQIGEKEEARKWYATAVEWLQKNQKPSEELRRLRAEGELLMGLKEE